MTRSGPRRCDGHHRFAVCGSGLASGRLHHPGESRPAEALAIPGEIIPEWWTTSSRNGGRNYLGMGGRHHSGIMGSLLRNPHSPVSGMGGRHHSGIMGGLLRNPHSPARRQPRVAVSEDCGPEMLRMMKRPAETGHAH
jgi:hypothetical protein